VPTQRSGAEGVAWVDGVCIQVVVTPARPADVVEARMNLPIVAMEQEVMELVSDSDVLVLCGETGCGKTTQMPQFLYEAGYGQPDGGERRWVCGFVCACVLCVRLMTRFSVTRPTIPLRFPS
jgi:HrpA-like RNA helicase